ncbi:TonB-dependent receptor [Blastomonas marina]|uniref:TonB-dependent receptor n=1 Tax=Blastomonas marina TaxID=1867408 RepID=UPI002AC98FA8|nr:TonB-dependent receptor [Blastomonas marina]WPZ03347.1 TonB-dependent receptor [Blastomonas marina]
MNFASKSLRRALLTGIAAAPFMAFASPTVAQDAQGEDDSATEAQGEVVPEGNRVIVTARRREEQLVDVPIAITAYSADQLQLSGAQDITEIGQTTPNVTLEPSRGTNSTLSAFIRGVGQQDPVSGFEQGVGIYLDDVYLNRPQAAVLDIYDIERIEVLRGPQGTLYGRNTVGGAVKYVSRKIDDELSIRGRATYGEYNQLDGVVSISGPVSGDGTLRLGAAAARLTRDGFGTNLTTGEDNYDKDIWALRVSGEVHTDGFFARLAVDTTDDDSNARGGTRLIPGLLSGAPILDNVYDTRGGLDDPTQEVNSFGVALSMEAYLGDSVTLRSISAYRDDDSNSPIDFDALPAVDLDVPAIYVNDQISQEFQVLYETDRLNVLGGFYFLDANALTEFDVRIFTTFPGLTAFTSANVETETFAVFGDLTYDLTDQLSLSVGGRYTWDERKATILRQNYLGGGSPTFGGAGIPFGAPGTDFIGSASFEKFTPRANLAYQPTPDMTLYASYSQGFKGGGFDPRGAGSNAPDLDNDGVRSDDEIAAFLSFAPESVDSYELGYKAALMDGNLNLAVAAFRADYTDVQIPGSVACTVGGLPSFCGIVSNAGKARFQGFEGEFNASFGQDWYNDGSRMIASGSVGYIDAEYLEYITDIGGTPTDLAEFREVQNTPEWTASGTLAAEAPLGSGELYAGFTLSYRSKTYQFEIPNEYLDQDGYTLMDASIVYRSEGNRWSIGLYGKNLTDERYKTSGYTFVRTDPVTGAIPLGTNGFPIPTLGPEGTLTAFYGAPRQVFVTLTFDY